MGLKKGDELNELDANIKTAMLGALPWDGQKQTKEKSTKNETWTS